MKHNQNPPPAGQAVKPSLLILYVLGLIVLFFGFTDITRVSDFSLSLFWGFLALLSVAVLIGFPRRKTSV